MFWADLLSGGNLPGNVSSVWDPRMRTDLTCLRKSRTPESAKYESNDELCRSDNVRHPPTAHQSVDEGDLRGRILHLQPVIHHGLVRMLRHFQNFSLANILVVLDLSRTYFPKCEQACNKYKTHITIYHTTCGFWTQPQRRTRGRKENAEGSSVPSHKPSTTKSSGGSMILRLARPPHLERAYSSVAGKTYSQVALCSVRYAMSQIQAGPGLAHKAFSVDCTFRIRNNKTN